MVPFLVAKSVCFSPNPQSHLPKASGKAHIKMCYFLCNTKTEDVVLFSKHTGFMQK